MRGLDLRNGVQGLTVLARRDLNVIWQQIETAAEAEVALNDVLPALIETYGAAAGTLAADWYDQLRDAEEVAGSFSAIPADIADVGAFALVGWAVATATDLPSLRSLIDGGMQRRISNFSRETVTVSSVADPKAKGWGRVGNGECDFCALLIGRGSVFSEASADFEAHDHCRCSAVPVFG